MVDINWDNLEILSIRPRNNVVLSKDGKVINPHQIVWNRNKATSTPVIPIAFDISRDEPASLEVQLSSKEELEGENLLEALDDNGTVLFSGKVNDSGTVSVQAQLSQESFTQLQSNALHWQLTPDSGDKIALGTTWMEIFWLDLSDVLPSVYTKGTPVEVLRSLSSITPLSSMGSKFVDGEGNAFALLKDEAIKAYSVSQIVQSIFSYNPPRYDIWNGRAWFISWSSWNNITLFYNAYLKAHNSSTSILNCYDAAAVLQYNLKYYGYATKYCFMQPFGYLRYTNLIGRGPCNNPFFGATGGPAYISPTNPQRTAFGNHAFVSLLSNGAIADACAGPHVGNENAKTYVNNATDNVYPNPPQVKRGTVANIGYYTGITSVKAIKSIYDLRDLRELPHTEAFKGIMEFSEKTVKEYTSGSQGVVGKWPKPTESPVLNKKWKIIHEEIVPGLEESVKIWMLKNGEQMIMIKLYVVSGGNDLAFNRFLSLGSLSQSTKPAYKAGPEGLGHYSAISTQRGYSSCFWVFHNVVLDIVSTDASVDTVALSQWYYQWATRNLTENLSRHLPFADIHYSSLQPKVGEQLYVSLVSDDNIMLDFVEQEEGLRLISEEGKSLVFDVVEPSEYDLKVLVVDKDTLLVNSQTLKLDVKSS